MPTEKTLHIAELPVEFEGKSLVIRLREEAKDLATPPSVNDYEFFLRSGSGLLHRLRGGMSHLKVEFTAGSLPIVTATFLDFPLFNEDSSSSC